MKKYFTLIICGIVLATTLPACKALAKNTAKRWAKKKRKEFLETCNNGAVGKLGDRGNDFCDCALDIVMKKYPEAEEGLALKFFEIYKLAKDCVSN